MVNQSNSIKTSESNTKQKGMRLFRSKIDSNNTGTDLKPKKQKDFKNVEYKSEGK